MYPTVLNDNHIRQFLQECESNLHPLPLGNVILSIDAFHIGIPLWHAYLPHGLVAMLRLVYGNILTTPGVAVTQQQSLPPW